MKKSIMKIGTTLLCLGLVVGCGNSGKKEEEKPKETEEKPKEPVEETKTENIVSDELYDFQVSIEGKIHTLPFAFSDLAEDGWAGDNFSTKKINPNTMTLESFKKDDIRLMGKIVNNGTDVLAFDKAEVGSLNIDVNDVKNLDIHIAKGIKLGASSEEIKKAFGEPSDESNTSSLIILTYTESSYANVKFSFDKEKNALTKIVVENLMPKKKVDTPKGDAPAVNSKYKAPAKLGDDYKSFNVKYAGKMYTLPAPMSEFIDDGWKVTRYAGEKVSALDTKVAVELQKNNQTLRTNVVNYSDTEQTVENCFVTVVIFHNINTKLDIELPGGITKNSTLEEVQKKYGPETKKGGSGNFLEYEYGKIFQRITIGVMKDTKEIYKIEVEHSPKTY